MKLIVGLGNPTDKYARTRHNVGFWVVDHLAHRLGVQCNREQWRALVGETRVGNEKVILCKPQTYMNLSGESVRVVTDYFDALRIDEDIIVVYDDMDFAPGTLKLRQQGSAGGHNGMKSIIAHLGTERFPRVRMGIGRPKAGTEVITHVLSPFSSEDKELVDTSVEQAAEAIEFALRNSFTLAMNRYNESGS